MATETTLPPEIRCPCGRLLAIVMDRLVRVRCPRCKNDRALGHSEDTADVRCDCGRLLARRRNDGLELRCPRCKHHVVVPN